MSMSKKRGRPFSKHPKIKEYRFRMSDDEYKKLNDICDMTHMNKADVLRTAIERMHEDNRK